VGFHVVIPARYSSTRLPGKPLLEIGGRPMILHVVERARASGADRVLVATDDARIATAVQNAGVPGSLVIMTDPLLPSGTDRVAAAAEECGWSDETIVVNLQGDEPFMPAALIDQVAGLLESRPEASIATLMTAIDDVDTLLDPNVVKVVVDRDAYALYFSRAPIPWNRDGAEPRASGRQRRHDGAMRHLGLYAYRVAALRSITGLPPSRLEVIEKLEQLRALENGLRIVVAECVVGPGRGIDTPADLAAARAALREHGANAGGELR
jgi:3-deoxy-manno-octulosonate cytidylyltransferase (CMP-KDO synthetase)